AVLADLFAALRGVFFGTAFFSRRYRLASGSSSTGQSANVSRYSWRTSAIRSDKVSSVQSRTEIGGKTATSTVPGFIVIESRAATISAFRITIGTIGMPTVIAMR